MLADFPLIDPAGRVKLSSMLAVFQALAPQLGDELAAVATSMFIHSSQPWGVA